jgi:hypothetical protein
MDTTQDHVIFIMGCMALFQIVDQIFNSHVQALFLNLNSIAMDPSIPLQNVEFLLFIATIKDFFTSCSLGVLLQELRYWVKPISIIYIFNFMFTK